ncbi:Ankyrin-like protein [Colletotrichum spinosum]|uniref:Ankyrin-like protein n=1 Tax=Colletotrichum spinosum TaxID=1347390 RepID=A0A4R8QKZ4_9PEZI|nr:Ankyrin-like protein [Colletotrichum spinosum]
MAIEIGNMEMTQLLLKYGEEINEDNAYVSFGRSHLQQAVENGDLPMIDLLLEEGANVNQAAANYHGATALQLSAIKRYLGIAKVLIDRGAHVDAKRAAVVPSEHGFSTSGFGRLQYLRAIKFAELEGHTVAANMLRQLKDWSSEDTVLWRAIGKLAEGNYHWDNFREEETFEKAAADSTDDLSEECDEPAEV